MGLGAVGQDHVQFFDVIQGFAIDDRVRAAGVVAYAAADTGPAGSGGVGGIHQAVGNQLSVQVVQHDAGLNPGPHLFFVHFDDLVQVFAEVGDYGMVHGLPGQAGAAGPGQHWDSGLVGHVYDRQNIVHVAGDDHAHRLHLVDTGVGAVENSGRRVELYITGDPASQHALNIAPFRCVNPSCCRGGHVVTPWRRSLKSALSDLSY